MKSIFKGRKKSKDKTHDRDLKRKGEHFPKEVIELLRKEGLSADEFEFCVVGDMDSEGLFCTAWIALDSKGLYIATGTQEVKKSRIKKKKLQTDYTLNALQCIPKEDFEKLKTEKYLSRGRLIGEKDGEDFGIVYFSVGLLAKFEDFAKTFNGENVNAASGEHERTCPKCNASLPPDRTVCPRCVKKSSMFKRLMSFFKDYAGKVAIVVSFILLGTGIGIFTPQISTKYLYDDILNAGNSASYEQLSKMLVLAILTIVGIKLLSSVLTMIQQYVNASIMSWVVYDIKLKIFSAMQKLSVSFYSSKQTGSLMERVNRDSNNVYWFLLDGIPYILNCIVTLTGVIVMMLIASWKLSLMLLIALPILVPLLVFGNMFFHRLHHHNWAYNADLTSAVSDNINGQRIIKAFSKEEDEFVRFSEKSQRVKNAELKLTNAEATAFPLLSILVYSLSAITLGAGSMMVSRGDLSLGNLLMFIVYLNMLQGPIDFLSWVSNWWARCADSTQRIFEVIDAEPEVVEKENPVELANFEGHVEINELEFEYEPVRPVIKKLSIDVPAGTMMGIVGKTGAGKTTIANLIARLYDAKGGVIKIDGEDVKDLTFDQLRTNIGLVSQDIFLFMGTIADNIRYARPEAGMEEVVAAAKAASAHDFIMKLPNAYETTVGSSGQDLSGGERQRVSIARTIIQNPKILILDEATAAMDTQTERSIQDSITRLKAGRTTIAIAHRLSTLRDADNLAVIDNGKVVECGTFSELIQKKGEFFKQYKIQSEALKYVGIGE